MVSWLRSFSKKPKEILSLLLLLLFSDAIASLALIIVTVTVSVSGQDCASLRTLNKWAFAKFRNNIVFSFSSRIFERIVSLVADIGVALIHIGMCGNTFYTCASLHAVPLGRMY